MSPIQPQTLPARGPSNRKSLSTMFEEDHERCFICQQPCKGLYCSSECRMQDRGVQEKGPASPATRASGVRLTSQIPIHLSPLARPTNHHSIGPSPRMPASNVDSSSSSSITSSPIQSPRTNPSGSDSPRKESFDLPPLAYPNNTPSSLAFPGSVPVKIPALMPKVSPPRTPGSHTPASTVSTIFPAGASIDTLRFGRKPGIINSVTSPNALLPRCACGKPANHRDRRAMSKDRALDSGFNALSLGPSVTSAEPNRTQRIVSESAMPSNNAMVPGFPVPEHVAETLSGSFLARSRSDPIPHSPPAERSTNIPNFHREAIARRASHNIDSKSSVFNADMGVAGSPAPAALSVSPRRGRSRERTSHPLEHEVSALLNHPPDREHPPSRSRHRADQRGERRRSDEDRERSRPNLAAVESPQITPSWSRHTSPTNLQETAGAGFVPSVRRSGQKSPEAERSNGKEAELRRASKQLGAVYGVAAG